MLVECRRCLIQCNDVRWMQAIYHGKPIVAMPFFADQLPNADKVVAKVSDASYICMAFCHPVFTNDHTEQEAPWILA